ncbi:MAG: MarR family transcriptional regulator [Gammaproteobacteria bacterium]|nr:MarR family transcriptional regulator [Gammaproteobacteria bacterium]
MRSLSQQHDLQNCACFNVRKSARVLTKHYDDALHPLGLKPTQFTILAVLSSIDAITVTDLAEFMVLDRTTLTRNLRPLEKQGMLKTNAGEDRRTRMISLSKKGLNKLEKAIPLWKQAQKQVKEYMGNNRFNNFLNELNYVENIPTV